MPDHPPWWLRGRSGHIPYTARCWTCQLSVAPKKWGRPTEIVAATRFSAIKKKTKFNSLLLREI